MIASKEQFAAFEKVRRGGTVDMFNIRAIVKASGVPRKSIVDLLERFDEYQFTYGDRDDEFSWPHESNEHYKTIALADYNDLCELFGRPGIGERPDGKAGVVWALRNVDVENGTIAIYNFEDSFTSIGKQGLPISKVVKWHIHASDEETFQKAWHPILKLTNKRFKH